MLFACNHHRSYGEGPICHRAILLKESQRGIIWNCEKCVPVVYRVLYDAVLRPKKEDKRPSSKKVIELFEEMMEKDLLGIANTP